MEFGNIILHTVATFGSYLVDLVNIQNMFLMGGP